MVLPKVLEEIWLKDDNTLFQEFSPYGKYSFLFNDNYLFRGERTEKYNKLLPTVLRENINNLFGYAGFIDSDIGIEPFYQAAELNILINFYRKANYKGLNLPNIPFLSKYILKEFLFIDDIESEIGPIWLPDSFLEIASLAQHYGLPTRLIDWSRDINIAMYFASVGALYKDDDTKYMVIYALDYKTIENLKFTRNKIPLRLVVPQHYKNDHLLSQKGVLSAWEYETVYQRDIISHNIFYKRQQLSEFHYPLPNYDSLDVLIQKYIEDKEIDWRDSKSNENKPLIYKFYIPISMSTEIYNYLARIGYGADRLFSGFDGVSRKIKDDFQYNRKTSLVNNQ